MPPTSRRALSGSSFAIPRPSGTSLIFRLRQHLRPRSRRLRNRQSPCRSLYAILCLSYSIRWLKGVFDRGFAGGSVSSGANKKKWSKWKRRGNTVRSCGFRLCRKELRCVCLLPIILYSISSMVGFKGESICIALIDSNNLYI